MRIKNKNAKGQAIVEYIIIIVIVAIAAFVVLGAFSDRLQNLIAGVTVQLGGNATEVADGASVKKLQTLTVDTGVDTSN